MSSPSAGVAFPARTRSSARPVRRDLRASSSDGAFYGVMVGVGETYVPAFVLAAGLSEVFSGLIASVPVLIGSLLQLISPWGVNRLRSYRRWVVLCAAIQGVCFLPLVLAALSGRINEYQALFITSIYWATSLATGPAWNTWMGAVVPKGIRANFFARRGRLNQATTLCGFLIGGVALQVGKANGYAVATFAALFGIAFVCRCVSAICLALQSEPVRPSGAFSGKTLLRDIPRFGRGPGGRILVFAIAMQVGVYISGPYFVPYMLKNLELSYVQYVTLIGASYIAKFVTLPLWGRVARVMGARQLLWIGALSVIPMASAWVVSPNYLWLVCVQLMAGTAWAAYELATTLLIFETIPEHERTNTLTIYNVANNMALVTGSIIGVTVLKTFGVTTEAYLMVFGLSTIFRAATIPLLMRIPSVRLDATGAEFRPLSLRPNSGSLDTPVLAALPDKPAAPGAATPDASPPEVPPAEPSSDEYPVYEPSARSRRENLVSR